MNVQPTPAPLRSATTTAYYDKVVKAMRADLAPGSVGDGFLLDYKAVGRWVDDGRSLNSRKTYYAVLKAVLKGVDGAAAALEFYNKKFAEAAALVKAAAESQKPTEREEANMITWEKVQEVARDIIGDAEASGDASLAQDAAIVGCWALMPPRRLDFVCRVMKRRPKDGNALVVSPKSMTFVFREFKTAKTFGAQVVRVPPALEAVLRRWLEFNSTGWLFIQRDGTPMTEAGLSAYLIRLFERRVGKKVGVDILRHAFITHLRAGEMSLAEKQELSEAMGHSLATNELYRRI